MERGATKTSSLIIVLLVVLIVVVAGGATAIVLLLNREAPPAETPSGLQIGYERGATILDPADAQQRAINDLLRGGPGISIDYRNDAYSSNGTDFECYIGNSDVNTEDMYIQITTDMEQQDTVFLSQLLRPGYALRNVTLNRALPEGANELYVTYTTVGLQDGEQVITGQTTIAMTFYVTLES